MSLDYHLFGDSPLPYHAHSLIWGVLLFLSFGLLLRWVLPGRIGAVAFVIYTLSTTIPPESLDRQSLFSGGLRACRSGPSGSCPMAGG